MRREKTSLARVNRIGGAKKRLGQVASVLTSSSGDVAASGSYSSNRTSNLSFFSPSVQLTIGQKE